MNYKRPFEINQNFEFLGVDGKYYHYSQIDFNRLSPIDERAMLSEVSRDQSLDFRNEEVVFFGGTFNPLHDGHIECVKLFKKYSKKKLVVLIDRNPHKDFIEREHPLKSYLEIGDALKNLEVSVYSRFLLLEKNNPTIEWFEDVTSSKKGLLLGDDSFFNLEKWTRANDLLLILDYLFVVPRLGEEKKREEMACLYRKTNPKLEIVTLDHHAYEDISSTKLRNK